MRSLSYEWKCTLWIFSSLQPVYTWAPKGLHFLHISSCYDVWRIFCHSTNSSRRTGPRNKEAIFVRIQWAHSSNYRTHCPWALCQGWRRAFWGRRGFAPRPAAGLTGTCFPSLFFSDRRDFPQWVFAASSVTRFKCSKNSPITKSRLTTPFFYMCTAFCYLIIKEYAKCLMQYFQVSSPRSV